MTRRNDSDDTDGAGPSCSRRGVLRAGAFVPFIPAILGIGGTDTSSMTPLLRSGVGWTEFGPHDRVVQYGGGGYPSISLQYTENSRESLLDWVNAEEDRHLISEHETERVATVAAPPEDLGLGGRVLNTADGLIQRDYVSAADLNVSVDLISPVAPASADEVPVIDRSALSWGERLRTDAVDSAGIAYDEDFEETPMADARSAMHADSTALGVLPDTSNIVVAIVDTGVNTASGAIFGTDGSGTPRLLDASKDFVGDGERTVAEDGFDAVSDPDGHGTWVASCLAASPNPTSYGDYEGFCPSGDVLALRALGSDGSGSTNNIARAVRYAADEGADVICLSLGSPIWSVDLDTALEYAVENGAVPFAATGNDRQMTTWQATPASSEHALGIAATTVAPPSDAKSAYFSNIGPNPGSTDFSEGETTNMLPDLGAPGTELGAVVADDRGDVRIRRLTGTSMAAPCSAGVAGLLIATGVTGYDDVQTRLEETARPVPAAGRYEVGHGMPSAQHAIDNSPPDETQKDARDGDAVARDKAYEAYSNTHGRTFFGVL